MTTVLTAKFVAIALAVAGVAWMVGHAAEALVTVASALAA